MDIELREKEPETGLCPEKKRKREKKRKQQSQDGFTRGYIAGFLTPVLIVFAFAAIYRAALPGSLGMTDSIKVISKINTLLSVIQENYLGDVDNEDLLEGAYDGLVDAVDDSYTRYYTAEEYEDYVTQMSGEFAGIGVTVQWSEDDEMALVLEVREDGGAEAAGVEVGDLIYAVDGTVVQGTDLDTTTSLIKGEEDTDVVIEFVRGDEAEHIEMTITRYLIEEETVTYEMMEDGIGYILLSSFDENTPEQFEAALEALQEEGMEGLILDLRGNSGGRLNACVEIADMLLPEGTITYTVTKDGEESVYTSDDETSLDLPLVVLVDENSASASEVLAGAIRDFEAGTLVGTTTYGKGVVQTTYSLSDGTAIKVTMANYYTPNGDNIHGVGITPDIEVELPEDMTLSEVYGTDDDTQYETALETLKNLINEENGE